MTSNKDDEYVRQVAEELCNGKDQMKYVLTALATAIQERLDEDIILCPRKPEKKGENANKAITEPAGVYSIRFKCKSNIVCRHYVFYCTPTVSLPAPEELLLVTLNVAHELWLLIHDRGPGEMKSRIGISSNELKDAVIVEAEWFALCVLQMYGFLFLEK